MYFATANGLVKATQMEEFDVKKSKIMACGLKENDTLIYAKPNVPDVENMIFITSDGMSINIRKNEISVMGRSGKGVSTINWVGTPKSCMQSKSKAVRKAISC